MTLALLEYAIVSSQSQCQEPRGCLWVGSTLIRRSSFFVSRTWREHWSDRVFGPATMSSLSAAASRVLLFISLPARDDPCRRSRRILLLLQRRWLSQQVGAACQVAARPGPHPPPWRPLSARRSTETSSNSRWVTPLIVLRNHSGRFQKLSAISVTRALFYGASFPVCLDAPRWISTTTACFTSFCVCAGLNISMSRMGELNCCSRRLDFFYGAGVQ